MTLDIVIPSFQFAGIYLHKLADDFPDERLAAQPVAGVVMNHGAWTLGHLAWSNDNGIRMLGGEAKLTHLNELVGMGSKPVNDRAAYPPKMELLQLLDDANARLLAAIQAQPPGKFDEPTPERMRARFPTLGPMFAGLLTSHYTSHIGQFSAWRRAMGFPSVF